MMTTIQQLPSRPILPISGDKFQLPPIMTANNQTTSGQSIYDFDSLTRMLQNFNLTRQHHCKDLEYSKIFNNLRYNLVPRLFLGGRKDPGRGWSCDTAKTVSPRGCRESIKITCCHNSECVIVSICFFEMLNHVEFLYCLEFAIQSSFYKEIILKTKQVRCL